MKTEKPKKVYEDMDLIEGPRNSKQVKNAKYRANRKEQQTIGRGDNFTDQVKSVEMTLHTGPFVQMVTHTKDKVPSVILYTEQQIESVRSYCCSSPHGKTTVLGFDKTLSLGNVHLTVCNFKNLSVKRKDTNDHPIFAGPMLLHGNSDLNTFRQFFQHPAWKLGRYNNKNIVACDWQ